MSLSEMSLQHLRNVQRMLDRFYRRAAEEENVLAMTALQWKLEEVEEEICKREFWEE